MNLRDARPCAGGGRSMQFMRTAVLLAAMTAMFLVVGALIGGRGGMVIALLFAVGTNLFAYWNSDRMALSAVDAREIGYGDAPDLVALVGELSARAGLRGLGFFGSIAMAILAPIAAMVVQLAVSRGREYEADRLGAEICGNPLWLASALAKIADAAERIPDEAVEAHPAMAHLFIVNPLTGRGMDSLFSTHPAVENRIAALEDLARSLGATWHAAPQPTAAPRQPAYETAGGWQPFRQPTEAPREPGTFLGGRGIAGDSRWNGGRSSSAQGPWG